jgi:hypothetical protein
MTHVSQLVLRAWLLLVDSGWTRITTGVYVGFESTLTQNAIGMNVIEIPNAMPQIHRAVW